MEFLYNVVFENPISRLFRRELKQEDKKKKYSKVLQHFVGFGLIYMMMHSYGEKPTDYDQTFNELLPDLQRNSLAKVHELLQVELQNFEN
eukprot:gene5171-8777_t